MRRALAEPDRLRVSKSGHDVLMAGPADMAFDSKFSSIGYAVSGEFKSQRKSDNPGQYKIPSVRTIIWKTSNNVTRKFVAPPILFLSQSASVDRFTIAGIKTWRPSAALYILSTTGDQTFLYSRNNDCIAEFGPTGCNFFNFSDLVQTIRYKALI